MMRDSRLRIECDVKDENSLIANDRDTFATCLLPPRQYLKTDIS